jgi:hypothetical protein
VANISDPAHAPDTTLPRIPEQRFCPDTEEVTGSNPVSPTMKALVSDPFAALTPRLALGSVDLSATVDLTLGVAIKELVDCARPTCNDWAQLLPVYTLGDACTSMADQVCDLLNGHPRA